MDNRSRGGSMVLCSSGGLLGIQKSPILIRSGKYHGYIRMDSYLHWDEAFWGKSKSKSMRA